MIQTDVRFVPERFINAILSQNKKYTVSRNTSDVTAREWMTSKTKYTEKK